MFRDFHLALSGIALDHIGFRSIRFEQHAARPWSLRLECDPAEPDVDPRVLVGLTARLESQDQGSQLAASGVVVRARRRRQRDGGALAIDIAPNDVASPAPRDPLPDASSGGAGAETLLVASSLEAFVALTVQLMEAPGDEAATLERFGLRGAADRERIFDTWRQRWSADAPLLRQWRELYDARRRREP